MGEKYSRVLVVDDDPIIHQVLAAFFVRHGIAVVPANNGTEALTALGRSNDIDLIVSDIHMPDMDGIELLLQLHANGCKAPIVVISSASAPIIAGARALASAHNLDLVGLLGKPVALDALADMLHLADVAVDAA